MAKYTLPEFIRHIDLVIEKLEDELPNTFFEVWAKDMISRITYRVGTEGKSAKGGKFSPYDPKYLKWKQKKKGFKQTDKNFTLTTDMWDRFGITNTSKTPGFLEVTLAGTNSFAQDKMNWNSEREGISVIDASKEDREAQDAFLQKWLNEFLSKEL